MKKISFTKQLSLLLLLFLSGCVGAVTEYDEGPSMFRFRIWGSAHGKEVIMVADPKEEWQYNALDIRFFDHEMKPLDFHPYSSRSSRDPNEITFSFEENPDFLERVKHPYLENGRYMFVQLSETDMDTIELRYEYADFADETGLVYYYNGYVQPQTFNLAFNIMIKNTD